MLGFQLGLYEKESQTHLTLLGIVRRRPPQFNTIKDIKKQVIFISYKNFLIIANFVLVSVYTILE